MKKKHEDEEKWRQMWKVMKNIRHKCEISKDFSGFVFTRKIFWWFFFARLPLILLLSTKSKISLIFAELKNQKNKEKIEKNDTKWRKSMRNLKRFLRFRFRTQNLRTISRVCRCCCNFFSSKSTIFMIFFFFRNVCFSSERSTINFGGVNVFPTKKWSFLLDVNWKTNILQTKINEKKVAKDSLSNNNCYF